MQKREFFHIEMASRTVTALDQLNHIIDATFSSIEQFERFDRYTTLQSLYTALDHQVEDGLTRLQESDRMRFIVGNFLSFYPTLVDLSLLTTS